MKRCTLRRGVRKEEEGGSLDGIVLIEAAEPTFASRKCNLKLWIGIYDESMRFCISI